MGGGEGNRAPVGCLNSGLFTAVGGKTNSALIYTIHMSTYFRYTQTHQYFSSSLPVKSAFVCAAPYPLRLSVITVSLRSRHPPGGLNLLINLVLIVCAKAPIMS